MAGINLARSDKELEDSPSDLEQEGVIQRFEYTHELAWKVMKDYFEYQGNMGISGSRDATREAFKASLITDGEAWMEMIKSRNETAHTYNEDTADQIFIKIIRRYYPLFRNFRQKMEELKGRPQNDLFSGDL